MGSHIPGLPHSPCTSTTGILPTVEGRSEDRPSGLKRNSPAVGAGPRLATELADGVIARGMAADRDASSPSGPTGMEPEPTDRIKARMARFWNLRRKAAS